MEQVKESFRTLTQAVCRELDGIEIPSRPVWTVVNSADGAPQVALDAERRSLSDLRLSLSLSLLRMTEYGAVADAIENEPELSEGIIVDAGGYLGKAERVNLTRALVTNFLWQYLQEGQKLAW